MVAGCGYRYIIDSMESPFVPGTQQPRQTHEARCERLQLWDAQLASMQLRAPSGQGNVFFGAQKKASDRLCGLYVAWTVDTLQGWFAADWEPNSLEGLTTQLAQAAYAEGLGTNAWRQLAPLAAHSVGASAAFARCRSVGPDGLPNLGSSDGRRHNAMRDGHQVRGGAAW